MSHFIEKCPKCNGIVSQCRCMSCDKVQRVSKEPCENCKKEGSMDNEQNPESET
jgi:RecJ-like exonuclease